MEPESSQRLRRSPSPQESFQFSSQPKTRFGSLIDKHKSLFGTTGQLSSADNRAGLLEKSSVLSKREQKHAVSHRLGDKENHSVSSVKTMGEKHSTATADGFGGRNENVLSLSTVDESLSISKFVGGIGHHVVSSRTSEDELHTASSLSATGEEKVISSSSKAADEKHSVFASGTGDGSSDRLGADFLATRGML